jgi:hypothetical protein
VDQQWATSAVVPRANRWAEPLRRPAAAARWCIHPLSCDCTREVLVQMLALALVAVVVAVAMLPATPPPRCGGVGLCRWGWAGFAFSGLIWLSPGWWGAPNRSHSSALSRLTSAQIDTGACMLAARHCHENVAFDAANGPQKNCRGCAVTGRGSDGQAAAGCVPHWPLS